MRRIIMQQARVTMTERPPPIDPEDIDARLFIRGVREGVRKREAIRARATENSGQELMRQQLLAETSRGHRLDRENQRLRHRYSIAMQCLVLLVVLVVLVTMVIWFSAARS